MIYMFEVKQGTISGVFFPSVVQSLCDLVIEWVSWSLSWCFREMEHVTLNEHRAN